MNTFLLLLIAVVAVAATGSEAFPETLLDHLFRRGLKSRAVCSGDVSEDMAACLEPLENLSHPTSGIPIRNVETREQLNIVCMELHTASACVHAVHENCGQEDFWTEMMSDTIMNVVEYVCDPYHADVILDNTECWENKNLEEDIQRCSSNAQYSGDACMAFNSLRGCIKDQVEDHCNNDAAEFMDGMIVAALEPIATDYLGCDLGIRVSRSLWNLLPRSK